MKRIDVESRLKWRKEDIFVSVLDWEGLLAELNKDIVNVIKFKGRLGIKESLLEYLQYSDEVSKKIDKLYCYAMLTRDEDLSLPQGQELVTKISNLCVQYGSYSAFVTPELSELDDYTLNTFINDRSFHAYNYSLKTIMANKKHILSQGEERILALSGKVTGAFRDIFKQIDDVDMKFPSIKVDGEKKELTQGYYGECLRNKDVDVRKKAFKSMYAGVNSFLNTTSTTYASSVKKDNFLAEVRGYGSALEKSLEANDVPIEVYKNLIKQVNNNIPLLKEYIEFRADITNAEKLHMYDLHYPIFDNAEIKLDYDKAYELVVKSLLPLGEDYCQVLKTAYEDRWVDVVETDKKRSGAYSCGVYGAHPYVLLNYKQTTNDIFTIAHEMGHAMHSYYSSQAQPYAKHDYSIFVAEVASTVNEVLLLKHLLETTTDKNVKKFLLSQYLDMFRTTLFRQTMFAEFESLIHTAEAKGTPLTKDYLCAQYLKLNKKYYGTEFVSHDKPIRTEWARIPHFYSAFYVYQYSTGLTSAVSIANQILTKGESAVDKYKKFLCAGGKKSPYEILKDVGVDLKESTPYDTAFGEFKDTLKKLIELC